jgi:hypothetical protein
LGWLASQEGDLHQIEINYSLFITYDSHFCAMMEVTPVMQVNPMLWYDNIIF